MYCVVVNKYKPGFLETIDKPQLAMLAAMLKELKYEDVDTIVARWGLGSDGKWDENKLSTYKYSTGPRTLVTRMKDDNYTFFLLYNDQNEFMGLASVNAIPPQLRALNFYIDEKYRTPDLTSAIELMKHVSNFAAKYGFTQIATPFSAKGKPEFFLFLAKMLGSEDAQIIPHERDKDSVLLVCTPTRFPELDPKVRDSVNKIRTR